MTETIWVVSSVEELKGVAGELLGLWKQSNRRDDEAVVVALSGDLGAGKTTFIQQLAQILGIDETVTSPTFVIMKSYETTDVVFETLVHMDAYRIEDDAELAPLNFPAILERPKSLICIEWAERISTFLPSHTIKMDLELLPHGKHQVTYYAD
ncbi:tRNA (adenosine(37)-N6)-threonylcarbamoyltransferase complex ATPase subunit type 1 TsaE [Patescibacteria group bacterium]|nr:tRNA (adenosine(37)-N6)-threonylcarbamoyltransferase complex ATPase subunit type 1 TsaE [Patescibacteria group bacterium]